MNKLMLALFVQARGAFAQLIVIYLILCTVPLGFGVCLFFAPHGAGNFLNDAFAVFPHVERKDWLKKLFCRTVGLGFIGASTFHIHQIYWNRLASFAFLPQFEMNTGLMRGSRLPMPTSCIKTIYVSKLNF